ncbi:MAG: exodeoxyribonuclease VII small subunit [Candidatus Aenigmatarchaeota archaeon]
MPEEKFNFTKAYQEIEKINDWFHSEDIDLDEALKKYERGMELIKRCKERLKEAENKFEEIKKKYLREE